MDKLPCNAVIVENAEEEMSYQVTKVTPECEKMLQCGVCSQWFSDLLEYISHHVHVQHHSGEAFTCLLCKETHSTQERLQDHYAAYHKVVLNVNCGAVPLEDEAQEEEEEEDEEEPQHVDHSYYRPEKEGTSEGDDIVTVDLPEEHTDEQQPGVDIPGFIEQAHPEHLEEEVLMQDTGGSVENPDEDVAFDLSSENLPSNQKIILEEPAIQERNLALRTSDGRDVYVIDQCETSFTATPSLEVTIKLQDDETELEQSLADLCDGEAENDGSEVFCAEKDDEVSIEADIGMISEGADNDFQFISGLKHRRLHIANSNMVTDFGMQVFICLHCDFVSNEDGLVSHMKLAHRHILSRVRHEQRAAMNSNNILHDRVFPEDITGEEIIWLSEYHKRNLEQKATSRSKQKRCSELNQQAGTKGVVTKKRYYENRTPSLCPECGKILCRKSALRTHMLGVHSQARNHLCEVCGKAFRSANQLSQHRKTHRKKIFTCDVCDFKSDVRTAIFDHQQLHPSKFSLCHVCGTVVKSKIALTRHMMVHSMSRPYPCTVEGCTWRFKSKVLCKGHVEAHTSRGEFICLECKRHFRKRHHVRRHLTAVHGIESKSELDSHIAVDTKAMPSPSQFSQLPVTQLSKQHIMITTDEHGNPIFGDDSEELVFDPKTL